MPNRLTKIYTRTGDDGTTTFGDNRIYKDDAHIETIGTLDELNSAIGLVYSFCSDHAMLEILTQIQQDLFDIGAELHQPFYQHTDRVKVQFLENTIDEWNKKLPALKEFILPRGRPVVAAMHMARTICRRAERRLVAQHQHQPLSNLEMLRYLNRLSDLLFVAARILALAGNEPDQFWQKFPHA